MHRRAHLMALALAAALTLAACENTGEGLQQDLEENVDEVEEQTGDDG